MRKQKWDDAQREAAVVKSEPPPHCKRRLKGPHEAETAAGAGEPWRTSSFQPTASVPPLLGKFTLPKSSKIPFDGFLLTDQHF